MREREDGLVTAYTILGRILGWNVKRVTIFWEPRPPPFTWSIIARARRFNVIVRENFPHEYFDFHMPQSVYSTIAHP